MSLILEALRKSEAERRRGQAPDLLTDTAPNMPARQARSRDMRVIAFSTVAALVAALLLAAWWRMDTTPPVSARASGEAVPAAESAATPSHPLQPPRLQPPAPRRQSIPPPTPPREAIAQPAAPPASVAPAENARATPDGERSQASPIAAASTPAPASATAPVATFASPDVPLRLSDLSAEERQQLPALKVSMHMWAPDAANRFAIIDGTRVNEGDRVGEAAVEAIQQDAVMLTWRGRRIRLPIR